MDLAPLPSVDEEDLLSSQVQSNESDSASTNLPEATSTQTSKKQKTALTKKEQPKGTQDQTETGTNKNNPDCSIPSDPYDPVLMQEQLINDHGDKTKFEIFLL